MIKQPENKLTRSKYFLSRLMAGIFLCIVTVASYVPASHSQTPKNKKSCLITIIHTNDIHAHDEPYLYKGKMVGGMARVTHIIRKLRKKCEAAGKNYVVADAGDVFQGSTLYSHYHGDVEVNLLNKAKYDIFSLGNHEFDDGASNVVKQFKQANFSIINCNLDKSAVPELNKMVKPYVVKRFKGEKVAFVGAITKNIELLSGGLQGMKLKQKGEKWTEPIKETVAALKQKGINKIILVSHCGLDQDKELARAIPDIDAIIGGHSHTKLDKRIVFKHKNGDSTTIVQTGSYGHYVGRLELSFNKNGQVQISRSNYRLFPVTAKTEDEPDIKSYVAEKIKPLLHLRREIVGYAGANFGSKIRRSDSAIGNLVCDALHQYGKEYGVQITMHNRGGIRGHLDKGPISVETVEQILPFDNYAVFSTLQGKQILEALEHSFSGSIGGKFMDLHGMKVAYDKSRPKGNRVVFALTENEDGTWSKLAPDKEYKFAINSYSFGGGEGYNFKGAKDVKKTDARMSVVLQKYLKNHKKVSPQKPNRIVAIKADTLKKKKQDKILLTGVVPGSRVSIISGDEPGVSTIYNTFPVPLNNASILRKKLRADKEGRLVWPGKKRIWNRLFKNSKDKDVWICIVAFPPKRALKGGTTISNPIKVEQRTD